MYITKLTRAILALCEAKTMLTCQRSCLWLSGKIRVKIATFKISFFLWNQESESLLLVIKKLRSHDCKFRKKFTRKRCAQELVVPTPRRPRHNPKASQIASRIRYNIIRFEQAHLMFKFVHIKWKYPHVIFCHFCILKKSRSHGEILFWRFKKATQSITESENEIYWGRGMTVSIMITFVEKHYSELYSN